ncbi:MAG TPA: hypothetical protein VE616_03125 [Candidatus Udaeobacter sp.]|nr:hypothetical protein [Candidatus Udaeobacter sp.]
MNSSIPIIPIEDLRHGEFASIPAKEILDQIIPLLRTEIFRGVRKIVLLDQDYWGKRPAMARYIPVRGTKLADIEIYFDRFTKVPKPLQTHRMYVAYTLTRSLGHEIYHHYVNGQRRIRKPKAKREEQTADDWGKQMAGYILTKLFPGEEYTQEWKRVQEVWAQEYRGNSEEG